jgi:hypothetical protein
MRVLESKVELLGRSNPWDHLVGITYCKQFRQSTVSTTPSLLRISRALISRDIHLNMYVQRRSGVDEFLQMGQIYEVVVYIASLSAVRVLLVSCAPRGGIQLMSISFAFRLHFSMRIL